MLPGAAITISTVEPIEVYVPAGMKIQYSTAKASIGQLSRQADEICEPRRDESEQQIVRTRWNSIAGHLAVSFCCS